MGLYTLLTRNRDKATSESLSRLSRDMQLFPWQATADVACMGGLVTVGVVYDGEKQNSSNSLLRTDGNLTCAIEGVISRYTGDGDAAKYLGGDISYSAAVMAAYEQHGVAFPKYLEGQYSAVLVDETLKKLLVCSSRIAFTPLYEYVGDDEHFFCSQLGPMAASGVFRAEPDHDAIATLIAYGELFEQESLIAGVQAMEPASMVEISATDKKVQRRRYWDFRRSGPIIEGKTAGQYTDILCDVLTAAADRKSKMQGRVVAGLSGGFDSRLVTGLLAPRMTGMTAWTFGTENAPDISAAKEVARRLSITEHWLYGVDPADIPEFAADFATTADGCNSANWAYAHKRKLSLRDHADIALNGFGGDIFLGASMTGGKFKALKAWLEDRARLGRSAPLPYLEWNRGPRELARFIGSGNKIKTATDHEQWVNLPGKSLETRAFEDFDANMGNVPDWYYAEQWISENRAQRFTMMSIVSDRYFFADDSLFYDYDVLDHCATVPAKMRRGHRLYIRILKKLMPDIANVTNSNTGLPATTPQSIVTAHKIGSRLQQKLLRNRSSHVTDTTALDGNHWARTSLRGFYGDLVNDQSTRTRPFWDGEDIVRRFNEHQKGALNFGNELGMIATVELFLRRWVDRP